MFCKLARYTGVVIHQVRGHTVDEQGRCTHWHSELDVVANRCIVCDEFWACHSCHEELAGHDFGRVLKSDLGPAVLCGCCGDTLSYRQYAAVTACPLCEHPFNPGCKLHEELYFA